MRSIGFPLIVVIALLAVVSFAMPRDAARRARLLKRTGFGLMAVSTVLFALFVVGETVDDPGGWEAVGLIAAWAVPLAALAALTWYRPDRAGRVLATLIAATIGLSIWFAADPGWWRALENRQGPIRTIVVFALSAAVALLGLKRTGLAGVMLLVLGIVPIVVSSLGGRLGFTSLAVASTPAMIAGLLYALSAISETRSAPPRIGQAGGDEQPMAA